MPDIGRMSHLGAKRSEQLYTYHAILLPDFGQTSECTKLKVHFKGSICQISPVLPESWLRSEKRAHFPVDVLRYNCGESRVSFAKHTK